MTNLTDTEVRILENHGPRAVRDMAAMVRMAERDPRNSDRLPLRYRIAARIVAKGAA